MKPQVTSSDTSYIWGKDRKTWERQTSNLLQLCSPHTVKNPNTGYKSSEGIRVTLHPLISLVYAAKKDTKYRSKPQEKRSLKKRSPLTCSPSVLVILNSNCARQRHSMASCWEGPPADDRCALPWHLSVRSTGDCGQNRSSKACLWQVEQRRLILIVFF